MTKRTKKRQYVTVVIQYAVSILKITKYIHIFEEFTKTGVILVNFEKV